MKAVAVLGVLLVASIAGCIGDPGPEPAGGAKTAKRLGPVSPESYISNLSKPVFDVILKENVKVPSFDGKRMDNWVFRPKVEDGTKVPVFINFSPYWYNLAPGGEVEGDNFGKYMIHEYVPRGYAVVLSSVRGTGYSEGCFDIGGEVEQKDAVAVIEHFAKQPWSNGNIAAGGKSYDGTTPQGAAIHAPEALKAIFPVSGISELYKYNYKGGIELSGTGAAFNARYYAGESAAPQGTSPPLFMADRVACPRMPSIVGEGVTTAVTGDHTPYWQERNYSRSAKDVKAALFFVHGFTDWNVKPDHILPWLSNLPADTPRKVWLHNWTLGFRPNGDGHVYPMREDWNLTMLRFLDQTLKGIDTGIFDEPAYQIQDSTGRFRWEEAWPPADAVPTRFYFTKASLSAAAPRSAAQAAFTDLATSPTMGGANQCRQAASESHLRYETTLAQGLHYAGEPIVNLPVQSDKPLGKVVVTLCALGPRGEFERINWGGLNLRHRDGLEDPQPVLPGAAYNLRFPLYPQDDVVPAGWKLVAYVGGTGGQFSPTAYGSTITITEGANAWIEFPVDPTVEPESPQPARMPCFAC